MHDDIANAAAIEQKLSGGAGNDLVQALPDFARGLNETAATTLKGLSLATAAPIMAVDKAFGSNLTDKWFANTTAPLDQIIDQMGGEVGASSKT